MVRCSGGGVVAATVALLEQRNKSPRSKAGGGTTTRLFGHPTTKDGAGDKMESSPLKYSSSTDSGKDDHFVSTSSNSSDKDDHNNVCVTDEEDLCWMEAGWAPEDGGRSKSVRRGRSSGGSLERRRDQRRDRDVKARSVGPRCPCNRPPPPYLHQPPLCYSLYRPHCDCCQYLPFLSPPKPTTELEEQLRKLDGEKESLSLQVAVLSDQVDAQAEKISDLERMITEQKKHISDNEDQLQREILARSSLETQKLELLAVVSELKRHGATIERDNLELRNLLGEERRKTKPPIVPRNHMGTSSPLNHHMVNRGMSPSPSPIALNHLPRKLDSDTDSSTPIRQMDQQYRSLPRDCRGEGNPEAGQKRSVVFGRTTLYSDQPRCSSVPNLAETETVGNDTDQSSSQEPSPSMQISSNKGLRKILGKMKRSGSGNLDDIPGSEEFVRGGVRSTAGPRLCTPTSDLLAKKKFSEYTVDDVCEWLQSLGLDNSIVEARRWNKNGAAILAASSHEVDKELNIKGGLMCKKLHLMLDYERGGGSVTDPLVGPARLLGPAWVLRWLDDIGLPQYKPVFSRFDGHMLHRLTIDDLHIMHVTSALHVASIRQAIHVLRKHYFDGNCLIRRSDPEHDSEDCDDKVELWTNHRVMEWLRSVDLAEYAPNLRGSGVHGALMMHEERFTETLLASVLSIPSEKSLLRRHLATQFKQLLGAETIHLKRQAEASLGYVPLTTAAKIKISKKSQFTLKRKKNKFDMDDGELVCPLNETTRSYTGDSSSDLSKSPAHIAASPKSINSLKENSKDELSEKTSNV